MCKKIRGHILLELLFKDGSPMCSICGDDIRSGFTYYIQGGEVSKDEFNDNINEEKYNEED